MRHRRSTSVALIAAGYAVLTGCQEASTSLPPVVDTTQASAAHNTNTAVTPTSTPSAAGTPATVTRVVDGDTVAATVADGAEVKVRILGIDTPETHKPNTPVQCYGPEATEFARTLLLHQAVRLVGDPTQAAIDQYGRSLFYVRLPDGRDYSVEAARAGMGREYIYDHKPVQEHAALAAAQAEAQTARRGLWGACSGPGAVAAS